LFTKIAIFTHEKWDSEAPGKVIGRSF